MKNKLLRNVLWGYLLGIVLVIIVTIFFYVVNRELICCSEGALRNIEYGNGNLSSLLASNIPFSYLGFVFQDALVAMLLFFNSFLVIGLLYFKKKISPGLIAVSALMASLIVILALFFDKFGVNAFEGFMFSSAAVFLPISLTLLILSLSKKIKSGDAGSVYFSLLNFIFLAWFVLSFVFSMLLYFD